MVCVCVYIHTRYKTFFYFESKARCVDIYLSSQYLGGGDRKIRVPGHLSATYDVGGQPRLPETLSPKLKK